jgi:hypothetical protein
MAPQVHGLNRNGLPADWGIASACLEVHPLLARSCRLRHFSKIGRFLGYTGRGGGLLGEAAHDPQRKLNASERFRMVFTQAFTFNVLGLGPAHVAIGPLFVSIGNDHATASPRSTKGTCAPTR